MADYYDKRDAKVKIYHALVENGWKCFGYKEDESDSMTDYFSPSDWDGVAEKNGFVLLVGICKYDMSKSGYKQTTRTVQPDYAKIQKLQTLADDAAATEGEKTNALAMIQKLKDKSEASVKVLEQFPVFHFENPGKCSWHIEKDGQIIAKGMGAFAVNDYDWENKEKTKEQQKAEKLKAFIDRIEKAIHTNEQLESEVVKVAKKVIKPLPVKISVNEITDNTIIIFNVSYTNGNYKGSMLQMTQKHQNEHGTAFTFNKLGKRMQPLTGQGKTYYLGIEKLASMVEKGHISFMELQEVTEYEEKTVYKKTARKQKVQEENLLNGEVMEDAEAAEQETKVNENTNNSDTNLEPATSRQLWALHCATKLDTRELKISKDKASDLIGRSKKGENITAEVKAMLGITEVKAETKEPETVQNDRNTFIINRVGSPFVVRRGDKVKVYQHNKPFDTVTVENISHADETINGYPAGYIYPLTVDKYTKEEAENIAEGILDVSFEVLVNLNTKLYEATDEQKELYRQQMRKELQERGLELTVRVMQYFISNNMPSILSELETIQKEDQRITAVPNASQQTQQEEETAKDSSSLVPKIEKAITSAQTKLDSLSGDYLTNTWKRMKEEESRQMKRDALREEIQLLEYLKERAAENSITELEINLITGSFREVIKNQYNKKYKRNLDINYPVIDSHLPSDSWYNKEVPKMQKRYNRGGIYNTEQLLVAVEEFKCIMEQIEKPKDAKAEQIRKLENQMKLTKLEGYFPTPKNIVQMMLDVADITDGESVLEPSAGNGNILDGIRKHITENSITAELKAIEYNNTLKQILDLKGYNIVDSDFLEHNSGTYDKIIMNPPFEKNQDIRHVLHAYNRLNNNGRIVAIMSPHFTFANDKESVKFREWLDYVGYYEPLPEGSFKDSGTNVNTVLVVIDKAEQQKYTAGFVYKKDKEEAV